MPKTKFKEEYLMRINQNISAMNTYSRLTAANNAKGNSLAKLSSGLRINKAGDDAAGLAISEKMRGQIGGLNQAIRNAQDGISLIQTAEGALTETHSILQRMRDLAVQSRNGTNQDTDRAHIQAEVTELLAEIDRIATQTNFNKMTLMSGAFSGVGSGIMLQIGANQGQTTEINIGTMTASGLGLSGVSVSGAGGASGAIASIDEAIEKVSAQRASLGAAQNRLEHTINNLTATSENLSAAEARIRDVDMAEEMMEFTRTNILSQASTAMLAQANQMPNSVLQLLQ
jgi:flagellin